MFPAFQEFGAAHPGRVIDIIVVANGGEVGVEVNEQHHVTDGFVGVEFAVTICHADGPICAESGVEDCGVAAFVIDPAAGFFESRGTGGEDAIDLLGPATAALGFHPGEEVGELVDTTPASGHLQRGEDAKAGSVSSTGVGLEVGVGEIDLDGDALICGTVGGFGLAGAEGNCIQ